MALTKATYSMINGASVNVLDYGASTTNTASQNNAAFALALAAVASGGLLYIPTGTYQLSSTLAIPSSVTVQGNGRNNTRLNFTGCTGLQSANGNQNVRIEGLYITGNSTASTYGVNVVNNPRGFVMRDCYIDGFGTSGNGAGVSLSNDTTYDMWGALLEQVIVEGCGRGIVLNNTNATTLISCIARLNLGHSLVAIASTITNVIGGLYENPVGSPATQYNIYFDQCQQFTITGVWSENAVTRNLILANCNDGVVTGCLFDNIQGAGPNVAVTGGNNITFIRCKVENIESGETGVYVDSFAASVDTSGINEGGVNLGTLVNNNSTTNGTTSTAVINGFTLLALSETPNTFFYPINSAGAVSSDATTAIVDGVDGSVIIIMNTGSNNITIKNAANTALVGATDYVMGQNDTLTVIFSRATGLWHELARSAT